MTAKELLQPRFEVIELYPKCPYNKGRILTLIKNSDFFYECVDAPSSEKINSPELYPHLFKKLNWWEKRDIEDMPKKLKSLAYSDEDNFNIEKEEVYEISEWNMESMYGIIDLEKRQVCSLESWNPKYGYIPVD